MGEQNEREAYNEAAREDYEGREREEMDRPLFTQREVDADIAAAVRAEREAILSKLVDELNRHRTDDGGCKERFCGRYSCSDLSRFVEMIRSRPSPAVDVLAVVREYIDARANCDWRTDTVKRYAAASDALRALVAPRTAEESKGEV